MILAEHLYPLVRVYAYERGKPLLTWEEFEAALSNYIVFAQRNN